MGRLMSYITVPASSDEMSDEALVAACATGDRAALTFLFRRYHNTVDRFLSRFTGVDDRDLDDLVQATFIAVNSAAVRFRRNAAVRTWILGIATNVARKHIRTEVRHRAVKGNIESMPVQSASSRPDESTERRQALDRIELAIAQLPHDLRVVFIMCVLEDVPGKEAARVLKLREGTLWRRLYEARTALRNAVEERSP
jgi:RNA polymerase sigma-70 factor (ECF subfamily)